MGKTDKADYSAFVAVCKGHDGNYYVDANIDRRPSTKIVNEGIEWMKFIQPNAFGCESNGFQELLAPQFESRFHEVGLTLDWVFKIRNDVHKMVRIRSLTSRLAQGRIKVRRSPGSALLVEQLKGFPAHKHDDGPDALEMAIRLCEELLRGGRFEPQPEVLVA